MLSCPQVDIKGSVYNLWVDKQDQPQRKYVGELSELQTMDIRSLAGIPVRELQREFGGRFDGQYTFFKSDEDFMLPPNAPVLTDEKVCWLTRSIRCQFTSREHFVLFGLAALQSCIQYANAIASRRCLPIVYVCCLGP